MTRRLIVPGGLSGYAAEPQGNRVRTGRMSGAVDAKPRVTNWPTGGGRTAKAARPSLIGVSEHDEPGDDAQLGWMAQAGHRRSREVEGREAGDGTAPERTGTEGCKAGGDGELDQPGSRPQGRWNGDVDQPLPQGRGCEHRRGTKRATVEDLDIGSVEPACRGDQPENGLTRQSLL